MIEKKIMPRFIDQLRSGQMPDNAIITGWANGVKPPNAVDIRNDALMTPWAQTCTRIAVRMDKGGKPRFRLDSDLLRQGLTSTH
jgi:hypothetical protein